MEAARAKSGESAAVSKEERGSIKLTRSQGRVLALLGSCTQGDGTTVMTKASMADLLSLNEKTVDRAISRLKSEGLIEVVPKHNESGAQLANGYRVIKKE